MNRSWRKTWWLLIALCGVAMMAQRLIGQPSSNPGAPTVRTNHVPPALPLMKSPVESFRELLVMPAAEQGKILALYPAGVRNGILAKIAEYRSLTPEERVLRLQVTELRWYLIPVLNLSPTDRAAQLALMPPAMRELVEPRLQRWTLLPPPLRQALLTNDQAIAFLIRPDSLPTSQPDDEVESRRRRLNESFSRLMDLTPKETEKALRVLSDAERRQMEKTLQAFEKLPQKQRNQCIQSFAALAALSAADQQGFLKNAGRWSQMSPTERQTWRELVSIARTLPPLPPMPIPKPPWPPSAVPVVKNLK